jgi:hypothetical protein
MTWKDAARWNHGAHPFMTLVEGNIVSEGGVDVSWGSSSHGLWFRNWFWGDLKGDYPGFDSSHPTQGFDAVRIDYHQNYYSLVGNVLGAPGMHTNWSNATLHPTSCGSAGRSNPVVYRVGCDDNGGSYQPDAWTTLIKHGNYDFKTQGVADWDGGGNHTLKSSYYYSSQPSFFGSCAWPPFGPEGAPSVGLLPARERYEAGLSNPPRASQCGAH